MKVNPTTKPVRVSSLLLVLIFSAFLAPPLFAQGAASPWENAVNLLQTSFTGPLARGLPAVPLPQYLWISVYGVSQVLL